jgi:hypothetical protein
VAGEVRVRPELCRGPAPGQANLALSAAVLSRKDNKYMAGFKKKKEGSKNYY